jgi:two-component system, NarL family, sensor kinase
MQPVLIDITFMITVGIASMLLFAAGFLLIIVVNQKKKWLLQKQMSHLKESQQNMLIEGAIKSEENERHRIAEQLHDEVGAILSSVRLHFSNIKTNALDNTDIQLLDKSKLLLDEGIQKVRSISHNLHSTLLKEFGLNDAITHFVNKTVQGSLINTELQLDETPLILNQQTDIGMYRIVQELLNNILKHAKATRIKIMSQAANNTLQLKVSYDGNGLSQEEFETLRYKPEGLGLKNIMNRMILLKGTIFYEKTADENSISLTIPVMTE